jgi:hypothetical protein
LSDRPHGDIDPAEIFQEVLFPEWFTGDFFNAKEIKRLIRNKNPVASIVGTVL